MVGQTNPRSHADLYSSMAPLPEPSGTLSVLREGIASTRLARRTWRYFWLRVSALFLGLSGLLAPFLASRLGVPDLSRLLVLPILVYSAFALALGGALELVRRPDERKGRSWVRSLFWFMALVMLAGAIAPSIAPHVPEGAREFVPLFLILLGMPLINQMTGGKKLPPPSVEKKGPAGSSWSKEVLSPRIIGITLALFLLTLVGALPGFVGAEMQGARFAPLAGGFPASVHAVLFVLGLALLLGIHAAVAERLMPRWPRLALVMLLGIPYALSLVLPGFPNCIDLFAGYLGWLEGQLAPQFWTV